MRHHFRFIAVSISMLFLVGLTPGGHVRAGEEFPAFDSSINAPSQRQPHVEAEVEQLVRTLFEFNAQKNLEGMSSILWQDDQLLGYTLGGLKILGWPMLQQLLMIEFQTVSRLEFPIEELHVHVAGNIGWYTGTAAYIRYLGQPPNEVREPHPVRETGIVRRINGHWKVVHYHESEITIPTTGTLQELSPQRFRRCPC